MDDVTQGGFIFAAIVVVVIACWWFDRIRHPKSWCATCRGMGRRMGWWGDRWRDCSTCSRGVRDRRV